MIEPKGSRILGALLLVVIIAVVFVGLWAFLSMAFVSGGVPSGDVLFTIGAVLLGAVAIATMVWLIRLVRDRDGAHAASPQASAAVPPSADGDTPAA